MPGSAAVAVDDSAASGRFRLHPARSFSSFVLATLVVTGFAFPRASEARCQIETLELPVRMIGSRAVATVGINGIQVPLTVDSGADYSFLTEAAAQQLKLALKRDDRLRVQGLAGRVVVSRTRVDQLQLLGGSLPSVEFIVGGNEPGAGTMGLMGRNLLSFTDTEYDLAHGMIRFHIPNDECGKANMAYWAGDTPVTEVELDTPFRAKSPAIRARVKLDGKEVMALFDSGAGTTVFARTARRVGVSEADMTPSGFAYGAGRAMVKAWTARFDRFELGGESISNNTLFVADYDIDSADMLVGIDFFLSHRIYISNAQSKMYLTYAGGKVFSLNAGEARAGGSSESASASGAAEVATADQLARRAAASAARQDYDGALADLTRAIELEPASASLLAQRGAVQRALKRPAKAVEDLDRALALDPEQTDARYQRAILRLLAKDRDGAKSDLDVLDRLLAPQAQMRFSMATFYFALEQPAAVIAQIDRWLPAHPNEIQRDVALDSRCLARLRLGVDLDKALDDCDEAVGSNSKNTAYLDHRGWVYLRLGRTRNALSDFDRSIESRPGDAGALYGRGVAKKRRGDEADGEGDLAAARKLQPDIETRLTRAGLWTP